MAENRKVNRVEYQGRVFKVQNLRFTPGGKAVCNARMSLNKQFNDEWESFWFTLTAWEEAADTLAACEDKEEVIVRGRMEPSGAFKARNGDEVATGFSIAANEVERLGVPATVPTQAREIDSDDVPF